MTKVHVAPLPCSGRTWPRACEGQQIIYTPNTTAAQDVLSSSGPGLRWEGAKRCADLTETTRNRAASAVAGRAPRDAALGGRAVCLLRPVRRMEQVPGLRRRARPGSAQVKEPVSPHRTGDDGAHPGTTLVLPWLPKRTSTASATFQYVMALTVIPSLCRRCCWSAGQLIRCRGLCGALLSPLGERPGKVRELGGSARRDHWRATVWNATHRLSAWLFLRSVWSVAAVSRSPCRRVSRVPCPSPGPLSTRWCLQRPAPRRL